jgi:haloalkane dehalogenase
VTPAWLDRAEYPFESRWLDVDGARMHYVDEGAGDAVLMVHGTPTWSFLYRHLVKGLADRWRCVVPDHLGFGLSDKPVGVSYRLPEQARRLRALIDALGLKDLTLVVHDFGGPIGLAHAIERPESVCRLVLFNTWMWSLAGDRRLRWTSRLLGSPLGRALYERLGLSTRVLWRSAVRDRSRYTPAVHRHYTAPLDAPRDRHATWVYARELLGAGAWCDDLWRRRDRLAPMPALLVWGMRDPAFGACLPRWRAALPHAEVVAMAEVGHAPPEERGPEVASIVARFLAR